MELKTKEKPCCVDCGSDNIVVDSHSDWDTNNQCWNTCNTFDEYFCKSCGESHPHANWKPVQE